MRLNYTKLTGLLFFLLAFNGYAIMSNAKSDDVIEQFYSLTDKSDANAKSSYLKKPINQNQLFIIEFYKASLKKAQADNNQRDVVICYYNLGLAHYQGGDFISSLLNLKSAVENSITDECSDIKHSAKSLEGLIIGLEGDKESGLALLKTAKECFSRTNYQKGISDYYHYVGVLNFEKGDYQLAFDNFFESLKLKEKINDQKGIAETKLHLVSFMLHLEKGKDAITYAMDASDYADKQDDKRVKALALNYMGEGYTLEKNYQKANLFIVTSQKMNEELDNYIGIVQNKNALENWQLKWVHILRQLPS